MSNKPKLYNGYILARKHTIIRNIHLDEYFEIYELSDGKKAILFHNISPYYIEKHYKIWVVNLGKTSYYYTIIDSLSTIQKIERTIQNMIYPKGFDAVVGMDDVKDTFISDIINPFQDKETYKKFNVSLPNAILLFGPPGCGKTYFIEKLSEELNFNFIKTSQSSFGSTYIHGTSLKIKEIFDDAKKNAPSILFIDEIDSLFPNRMNLSSSGMHKQEEINEFLVQMNNISKDNVILIAATNQPALLDEALLRTGRIDKMIYIGLPNVETRKNLFKFYLRNRPTDKIDYHKLAEITEGYNNSDISYICNEASKIAINKNSNYVLMHMFIEVLDRTNPSISKTQLEEFNKFMIKERR